MAVSQVRQTCAHQVVGTSMRFTNNVTIQRPQAAVFAYLGHFENVPLWNYAISETSKITDGPVAVGTRYLQTRTLPRRSQEEFEVIEFDPDQKLSIRGTLGPFHGEIGYLLESAGDGTHLANTMDMHGAGPLKLAERLGASRVKVAVAENLEQLRRNLETGQPG